jgi:hypothetical protein
MRFVARLLPSPLPSPRLLSSHLLSLRSLSLRSLSARLLSASLLAALVVPPAHATGLAFVVNSRSASVSMIDMTRLVELRRIPMLREPHHVALSPDGKSLLVGDTVGNEMFFLDPNTGAVQRRLPIADPYQLGFSPNGKWLVVNGLARDQDRYL